MSLPTFTRAGMTDLTFSRENVLPTRHPRLPRQRLSRSDSGKIKVATLGAADEHFPLAFQGLTQADVDALIAWFEDPLVNWSENSFTYTDSGGTAYTVQLLEPGLDPQQEAPGVYGVELLLIRVPGT